MNASQDNPAPEKPTLPALPRWKRRLFAAIGLAASALVALVAAETVCRMVYRFPQPQFLQLDNTVGHRLRPNLRGYYVEEGFSRYMTNSHGLRGREVSLAKPAGVFRIAVLGDSYVEALQVGEEATFCRQLERRLRNVEVLNFGVSGYGTAQEYLTYLHYVRPFRPDLVLLVMCPGNDIADNSRALSGGYPRPYFVLKNGDLALDNSFLESRRHRVLSRWGPLYYFVTDHSALAQAFDRWRRRTAGRLAAAPAANPSPTSATVEAGLAHGMYGPPATDALREAWTVTERLLLELARAVADDGSSFAIMTVTTGSQVDAAARERALREHPEWDLDYADRRLGQFAEAHGIPALILVQPFLEHHRQTGVKLHGFEGVSRGHWNAEGHRLAAELMSRFLRTRGLLPDAHCAAAAEKEAAPGRPDSP
ncbi:MAG: SGNH/GDSL hydrolase family protein [Candidatus Sumerlaeia bacterium]|nr:SGNH/GDSL hydrolase family protein [Candidatus Sumerlaeia bacterium]